MDFCLGKTEEQNHWYTLLIPSSELTLKSFSDVRKQEDIMLRLLCDFTDRFYKALKNAYEGQFYEVTRVHEEDPGMINMYHFEIVVNLEFLVFDEADRMLDMGFISAIEKIMQGVKTKPQTMLFSATFSAQMNKLAGEILRAPKRIAVARENTTAETIAHVVYPVEQERKRELLSELIGRKNWKQVLVFVNYKETANELVKTLIRCQNAAPTNVFKFIESHHN